MFSVLASWLLLASASHADGLAAWSRINALARLTQKRYRVLPLTRV